jgi:hypothetical protein
MYTTLIALLLLLQAAQAPVPNQVAAEVIATERATLNRWAKGDTFGFVEIAAPDITYFDPDAERRVDGVEAFKRDLAPSRGKFHLDRWEMLNPKVQGCEHLAVLTFNFVSWTGPRESRWNATEVYRKTPAGWRLTSSHWSRTQPNKQKKPPATANTEKKS